MKRDLYWDTIKFVLIFLVIYGHAISGIPAFDRFNLAMYNFLYMFHMPLFIFISGRFSQLHDCNRYKKGILRIFETYVVFQLIRCLVQTFHGSEFTAAYLYTPNSIMWYLFSLMTWRLTIFFIPAKFLEHKGKVIPLCFGISLLAGFIPIGNAFALQKSLAYLPIFALGYYSADINVQSWIKAKIPSSIAAVTILAVFVTFYLINRNFASVTQCNAPYWDSKYPAIFKCFERGVFLASALILSAMVVRVVPCIKAFSTWGSMTLFIYLFHSFALREFLFPLIRSGILPVNDVLLPVYSMALLLVLVILSRISFLKILLNPISSWDKLDNSQEHH